jgi:CRISPR-associated exonuclease Cas4
MGILLLGYLFFMNQFDPDEYVMLSALQHYIYCPRQYALIHIDRVWDENLYTLRGQRVHQKVDVPDDECIADIRIERALPLWSHRLGISGIADVVEFRGDGIPYPVEYKSGSKKVRLADNIQLCAQALCLEEMLDCSIPTGAIYHAASNRRREVTIDAKLRSQTQATIIAIRELVVTQQLPPPVNDKRCEDCSLIDACMPSTLADFTRTSRQNSLFAIE